MADFLALEQLLAVGRPAAMTVAVRQGQQLDFACLAQQAANWRAAFAAQPGRRFALYCHDSFTFAAALLGAWHAGVCVYLPADVLPATLARLRGEVDGFAGDIAGEDSLQPLPDTVVPDWPALERQAPGLVVFTSGSTGEPVAIAKQLSQLFDEVQSLAACFDTDMGEAMVLATVSHQHIYGLLFRVLWPLAAGRVFAADRLVFPEDIVAALAVNGDCVLVASPAHLKRLPDNLPWAAGKTSLRAVFSSGGPLPAEALPDCRRLLGRAPIEVYGSSETGGIAWRQRMNDGDLAWRALPGVKLQLDGEKLLVQSPHLAGTDWQRTEDRVSLLGDGFELLGRADRIVKIEEKRVSLTAMESALLATGLVAEVRVLPLSGLRLTLGVLAVPSAAGWALIDEQGKRALNARLRAALAELVEASVLPRRWRYAWTLPSNAQGKATEAALQAWFDPRRPAARLLSRTTGEASLVLEIDARSPYFVGHFPQTPILPGVTQLDWAVLFGRELFAIPAGFLRLEAVKFQQVIAPGSLVSMDLSWQAERGSLGFKLTSAAGAHASGRIVFGAPA
ncbi:AMP-binding protein [Chitinimonas viridis]|uniref:AMP-binding protein n=1 Tax=Chitinimonas viridis TaxID=664880 RepID=A0ABT8B459_9NEIS|nr:AMP-binding protein [Chitinimonas viridis]MDN3576328.1 AMP-binding protein [Chitinimonas viridis]